MELLTPTEAILYRNLHLNEAVEATEQRAVSCALTAFAAQLTARHTRLALIRYQKAQLTLALALTTVPSCPPPSPLPPDV
jgi:hypothetical protein